MNKCRLFALASMTLFVTGAAQDVIDNKNVRLGANAGRVVTLKEEMRIEDTGEGFYFKNPRAIRVSPNGDVLILDGQEQALHFDAQGRFIRNLFKKGQGPGELTVLFDIWATSERLYLSGDPSKFLVFHFDGTLDKEIILRGQAFGERFVRADAGKITIRQQARIDPHGGSGFKDIRHDMIEISTNDSTANVLGSFTVPGYVQISEEGGIGITSWNQLIAVPRDENTLIVSPSPDYLLVAFDAGKKAVSRKFQRPYERVKRTVGGGVRISGSASAPPVPEFQSDIYGVHVVDGNVWVQTSTVVEGKGILFDVFDGDGVYRDRFYLQGQWKNPSGKLINRTLTIAGGCVYSPERSEDDLIVIRKCRLVGL
jgi:hypothetical protein